MVKQHGMSPAPNPLPSFRYLLPPLLSLPLSTRHEAALGVLAAVPMGVSCRVHHLETGLWGWVGAWGSMGKAGGSPHAGRGPPSQILLSIFPRVENCSALKMG